MKKFGFVRVGSIVNKLMLADPISNAKELVKMIKEAAKKGVAVVSTPQLSLTGFTCGDLFFQEKLLDDTLLGLKFVLKETEKTNIISIVGMPLRIENNLYNVGVVVNKGKILGIVPKTNVSNYNEEARWFTSSNKLSTDTISLFGDNVLVGANLIF